VCECVCLFCQATQWAAYITKEIFHPFATEKTPYCLVHSRKHTLNWRLGDHNFCYTNYWTRSRFDNVSRPGSTCSGIANKIASLSKQNDVYSAGEWRQGFEFTALIVSYWTQRLCEDVEQPSFCAVPTPESDVGENRDKWGLLLRRFQNIELKSYISAWAPNTELHIFTEN